MEYPMKKQINGVNYTLIKTYSNYALYKNEKIGCNECFNFFDLGMIPKFSAKESERRYHNVY